MPTDTATLIWCIVVPAIISTTACVICVRFLRGADGETTAARSSFLSGLLAVAWTVSVALSLQASDSINALTSFDEDAWPKVIWPMLAVAICVSSHAVTRLCREPGLWVLVGIGSVSAASLVMPSGDGWTDMLPLHQPWIAAITIAATCNMWALHRMANHGAERWLMLVILAGLACPAIIGAAAYGALLQTCLAAIITTIVIASFAGFGRLPFSPAVIFPSVLFMATMLASGRFYSYADAPPGDYGIALFAPALIALADRMVLRRRVAVRIAVAAATAMLIVGFVAYRFLIS